jgi:NAD(P)H-hydrate epimerase
VTFIGQKAGLYTGSGPDYVGKVYFDDLDVPDELYARVPSNQIVLDKHILDLALPPRKPVCHKGQFGHVLVVGGDTGMVGAVRMAAEAAARVGAGLVSVATRKQHAAQVAMARPELMCHGIDTASELQPLLDKASVVAIGPGLGQSDWARDLLSAVLSTQLSLVLDADALNLIAKQPVKRGRWILTPHVGEASRLLGCSSQEVQDDRFSSVKAISEKYNCVAVLKGAGTLVQTVYEKAVYLCRDGNAGMATAGMGDVLTGIIAGLLAQGLSFSDAARCGVLVHALAADQAAQQGQRGMLATDLYPYLRRWVNTDVSAEGAP